MVKCPKVYKLPTVKWLKPIKRLIEDNNDNPKKCVVCPINNIKRLCV
jgi:hypothetical protein